MLIIVSGIVLFDLLADFLLYPAITNSCSAFCSKCCFSTQVCWDIFARIRLYNTRLIDGFPDIFLSQSLPSLGLLFMLHIHFAYRVLASNSLCIIIRILHGQNVLTFWCSGILPHKTLIPFLHKKFSFGLVHGHFRNWSFNKQCLSLMFY